MKFGFQFLPARHTAPNTSPTPQHPLALPSALATTIRRSLSRLAARGTSILSITSPKPALGLRARPGRAINALAFAIVWHSTSKLLSYGSVDNISADISKEADTASRFHHTTTSSFHYFCVTTSSGTPGSLLTSSQMCMLLVCLARRIGAALYLSCCHHIQLMPAVFHALCIPSLTARHQMLFPSPKQRQSTLIVLCQRNASLVWPHRAFHGTHLARSRRLRMLMLMPGSS